MISNSYIITSNSSQKLVKTWPVCLKTIIEAPEDLEGKDVLFCEDPSQKLLYSRCAGMHKESYAALLLSEDPFLCPLYCLA